ncbi:hypothetical protein BHM03_00050086 [Ensete ventricosum]|nr:hypothetical protein BHM03_00050086 [Ensete ventricosum]
MHLLRFPNSVIGAKVFVRKIDFKLRVMRLNRIESFYTFLFHFHSEGSEEEGRPATASPIQGRPPTPAREASAAHSGSSPQGRPAPLTGAAARRGGACGHGRLWPAHRGDSRSWAHPLAVRRRQRGSVVGRPQGAAAHDQPYR